MKLIINHFLYRNICLKDDNEKLVSLMLYFNYRTKIRKAWMTTFQIFFKADAVWQTLLFKSDNVRHSQFWSCCFRWKCIPDKQEVQHSWREYELKVTSRKNSIFQSRSEEVQITLLLTTHSCMLLLCPWDFKYLQKIRRSLISFHFSFKTRDVIFIIRAFAKICI